MPNAWHILGGVVVCVLLVWLADRLGTRTRSNRLRKLAHAQRARYSATDRFNLAPRIADSLPEPGAADVLVRDLMYRGGESGHDYVFTVVYTVGTITGAKRRRRVALAHEPEGRSRHRVQITRVAETDQPLSEQYQSLLDTVTPPRAPTTP